MRAWLRLVPVLLMVWLAACEGGSSPDGNTSWMKPCSRTPECASGLSCLCGICSRMCEEVSECRSLGEAAACSPASDHGPACAASYPGSGLCILPSVDAGASDTGVPSPDARTADATNDVERSPEDASDDSSADAQDDAHRGDASTDAPNTEGGSDTDVLGPEAGEGGMLEGGPDGCVDSDDDGVCNDADLCPGFPDGEDADEDGRPDGCEPVLLRDFNTTTESSELTSTAVLGNMLYFVRGSTPGWGFGSLWRLDMGGTLPSQVTFPVDPAAGGPIDLQVLGDQLLVVNGSGDSLEIWATTNAGDPPVFLATVTPPAPELGVTWEARVADGLMYFWATSGTLRSFDLWRTDGTSEGTTKLTSRARLIQSATVVGGSLYFVVDEEGGTGGYELWRSDGTVAGTQFLEMAVPGGSYIHSLSAWDGKMYFVAGDSTLGTLRVWVTDGTVGGARPFLSNPPPGDPGRVYATAQGVFTVFSDRDSTTLWRVSHDGLSTTRIDMPTLYGVGGVFSTASGTYAVSNQTGIYRLDDLGGSEQVFQGSTGDWTPTANGIYFVNRSCDECNGLDGELYRLDERGAVQLLSGVPFGRSGSALMNVAVSGERVVFVMVTRTHGAEPWVSDGTAAGTHLLADLNRTTRGSNPGFLGSAGGNLAMSVASGECNDFFSACDPHPWIAQDDGQLRPFSNPPLTNPYLVEWGTVGGSLFLRTNETTVPPGAPLELFRMDAAGRVIRVTDDLGDRARFGFSLVDQVILVGEGGLSSVPLADMTAETPSLASMTQLGAGPTGDATWNVSSLGDWRGWKWMVDGDEDVWRTDGTAAGTVNIGKQSGRGPLVELGDWLYFFGADGDLFRTQGAPGDTTRAIDLRAAGVSAAGGATVFKGLIYFSALGDGSTKGYRTDGVTIEVFGEGNFASARVMVNGHLLAKDWGGNVWSTDGINPPVLLNANTEQGFSEEIVVYGAHAYFLGYDDEHGYELWRTDGTLEGTGLEADLEPGPSSSGAYKLHPTPHALYFSASVAAYGEEPWVLRH